jgi:hypothetical protein
VNQIQITGKAAKKKCRLRELLKDAYWKINRPKYACAATIEYVSVSCPNRYPAFNDSFSFVSHSNVEVTRDPCIAENKDPPNTPITPNWWNGCSRMLCSAWNTIMKLKVPEIPKGIPSENDPCPIGYTKNTAKAAATGAE